MEHPAHLRKTTFHALHQKHGAKLVPFAGYAMPVQYPSGIIKEHNHTRNQAGLFDISHMGQIEVKGENAWQLLESLMPIDIKNLTIGQQRYSLLLNEQGGILDDLMVARLAHKHFVLVVNAACKDSDLEYLNQHLADHLEVRLLKHKSLIALQGPKSADVMRRMGAQIEDMYFMDVRSLKLTDITCLVSRSGYTGEDGFEISVDSNHAIQLVENILLHDSVAWVGLGARDSLRLEAGLCLYGHDMDQTITPIEANLGWAISKSRRKSGERAGGFPGADIILNQRLSAVSRRRVGLKPLGRAPVREGAIIESQSGDEIGIVTSGGFSPTLSCPIAMGMLDQAYYQAEHSIYARVRNKQIKMEEASLPFIPHQYYRG